MLDLSIIIVNYNTKEFLRNCLISILSSIKVKLSYEIIVVDNASKDGTIEMVKEEFLNRHSGKPKAHPESPDMERDSGQASLSPKPQRRRARMTKNVQIIFIQNKENLGFSKANNIGIQHSKGKYLLFLNPDTIIYPNVLETMVDFMDQHKDAGAATCKLVMPNGKTDDASHRGFPTPWNAFCHFSGLSKLFRHSRLFGGYSLGWMDLSKIHEIDALCGAFMIVRREAGEEVGWWDEDYFFYGEDIDFCYMLKQKGWKIYYVPTCFVTHYKGVSGGIKSVSKEITTASEETKKRATNARFDAMKIFYKKHYVNKYPKIITWVVIKAIELKQWLTLRRF